MTPFSPPAPTPRFTTVLVVVELVVHEFVEVPLMVIFPLGPHFVSL